jgi:hypothetical protein
MDNYPEHTWMGPVMGNELKRVMKKLIDYHPPKRQSEGCTGPVSIDNSRDSNGCGINSRRKESTSRYQPAISHCRLIQAVKD